MKFIIRQFKDFDLTIHEATEQINTNDIISALEDFYQNRVTTYLIWDLNRGGNPRLSQNDIQKIIDFSHNLAVGESYFMKKGPGGVSVIDTPYGRIGITICRDLEFPAYVREAGRKKADIVLSPALDFPKGVTPSNTYNQMLRTIENGFSLVRAVSNGLSVAVDYHGRILSSMNYFTTSNEIMYADVPRKGTKTIYARIGDILPWTCTAGFLVCVVLSLRITARTAPKYQGLRNTLDGKKCNVD